MAEEKELEECPGFKDAGEKEGLEIWRIEDFEPVRTDKKDYGKFYNQDAYIVLESKQLNARDFEYNLHYWIGSKCHKDKQGTVAMRTVELDTLCLNSSAVQHRETQNHESKLFLSYFKDGIRYLEGGTESGFTHVDPDAYVKRLFQVKGKHDIRIEQAECNCGSLNQGDVFVLDDGPNIYVWVGPKSEKKEQLGGVEFARRIRDEEKGGSAHIHIVEEDWDTNDAFFDALGSREKTIRASDPKADDDIIRRLDQDTLLYEVAENKSRNGKKFADITEIGQKPLQQSMLKSEHCYVLDSGHSGLFLWTGKECSNEFKKKVWTAANEFLDTRGYPDWVSVTRVTDGGETSLFKQYFESWESPGQVTAGVKQDLQTSNIAESDYSGADGVDIESLHKKSDKIEDWLPDDGTGEKKVWRVEDNELVDVDKRAYGVFFGGDSYVVKYTYTENNKPKHIVYFWQGLRSTTNDQGAAAAFAVQIDRECEGEAVQIRVVAYKEPKHFMLMFGGKLVVFKYGRQRAFDTVKSYEGYDPRSAYMFQIRGTKPQETRAIQVDARGSSLDTNDAFIVDYGKKGFVWVGKNAEEQEKEMAKMMVERVSEKINFTLVKEGEEDNPFWNALGGQEEYYKGPEKTGEGQRAPPRLFHCSQASGRFTVEEIVAFTQQDLDESDVMILDTYDEIFIWVGKSATEWEKQEAMKTAQMYLECEPTGRTEDNTLIICLNQGFEPLQFTRCFVPWDKELWNKGKSFKEIMDEVGKENAGIALLEDEVDKYKDTYPLEELQKQVPPPGVDVTQKEMYLSDGDFFAVFNMTKEEYLKIPTWKRNNLRKEHGLF